MGFCQVVIHSSPKERESGVPGGEPYLELDALGIIKDVSPG